MTFVSAQKETGARRNTGPYTGCPTITVGDPQPIALIGDALSFSSFFFADCLRIGWAGMI